MKKFKLSMLILMSMLVFSACGGGGGGSDDPDKPGDDPKNPGGDKTISISVINGVTPPAFGETPVLTVTGNDQFEGTISWNTSPAKFAASTVYTATIELTAKDGYTLDGVSDDFFEVSGASVVSNKADSGMITAVFPATGSVPPSVVNIKAISGVTAPARDAVPVTTITETDQYTGTISWNTSPEKFAASTIYTATITLTAKPGYTFNGISENFFTVSGATTTKNSANSGVITAVFPSTITSVITFPSGTSFNMIITQDVSTTNKFPCNIDADSEYDEQSDVANVPACFMMSETEVTYELWYEVYKWATTDAGDGKRADGGFLYTFCDAGREGNDGIVGAKPTSAKQEPVTDMQHSDMIVWCNALTEYYNSCNSFENRIDCVYIYNNRIIRDSNYLYYSLGYDEVQCSATKGYRLPTSVEWEYSARYIGAEKPSHTNYVLKDGYYYTKGNSASGAIADFYYNDNFVATNAVAWWYNNSSLSTHSVKLKAANALGLYDMSGNVSEVCFELYPDHSFLIIRTGNYAIGARLGQVSYRSTPAGEEGSEEVGFRFCRSM
ncbi:MAG: SUMF1/EgtB/PvdO family nonheme iron enzyme [Spirochaetes bacterium]|nr:SUMF1/EgtB/PvdO family nonheme iron enzyme [Spirochaetota bacterium]